MHSRLLLLPIFLLSCLRATAQFTPLSVVSEQLSGPAESPVSITHTGSRLYATFASGRIHNFIAGGSLMFSTDDGQNWIPDPAFAGKHVVQVLYANSALYAVEYDRDPNTGGSTLQSLRIHRSVDNGTSYTTVHEITDVAFGAPPYNGYFEEGVFREVNGVLFFTYSEPYSSTVYLRSLYSTDGINWEYTTFYNFVLDNWSNRRNKISGSEGWFFYNTGWSDLIIASPNPDFSNSITISFPQKAEFLEAWSVGGKFVAFSSDAIYTSNDWQNPDSLQYAFANNNIGAAALNDGFFHLFDSRGLFYRAPANQPENPELMHFIPGYIPITEFAQAGDDLYLTGSGYVRSKDNGLSWETPASNLAASGLLQLRHNWLWMPKGFAYRSLDGTQWSLMQPQGLGPFFYDWDRLAEIQGRLFLPGRQYLNGRVYYSDDGGNNWTLSFNPSGVTGSSWVVADASGQRLYCLHVKSTATDLYYSDDKGESWEKIGDPDPLFDDFVAKGDTIFFAKNNTLLYSYDRGTSWNSKALGFTFPEPLHQCQMRLTPEGELLLIHRGNKVGYLSTDWGQNFVQILQMPAYFLEGKQDSLLHLSINGNYTGNNGAYISANNGVSGVLLKDTEWTKIINTVIKDGYLYGSKAYFGDVIRTDLQPALDALQYVSDFGVVEARTFFDRNSNCTQEPDEESVAGQAVVFQPGDHLAISDNNGLIRRVLPAGVYNLQITPHPYTTLIACQPLSGIGVTTGNVASLSLGMKPQGVSDLALSIAASPLRPGFDGYFTITVENKGVEPVPGGTLLRFSYPDNEVTFIDAMPAALNAAPGELSFLLPDIPVFGSVTFRVNVNVPPDPSLTGHYVVVYARLPPPYSDAVAFNHQTTRSVQITNSFDPNDKTAFTNAPGGTQMGKLDKTIQYLIRFQNTGTDTAFTIVVADTLSPLLDWTTLKTISASHTYRMTVADPGVVRWRFDNILLPDSTTNEPASHGYVLFNIDKKSSALTGDTIKNSAAIYFDFNHPVITNTTATEIVKRLIYRDIPVVAETEISLDIMPNPVGERMVWKITGLSSQAPLSAGIYDENGRLVRNLLRDHVPGREPDTLSFAENTGHLPAGAYRLVVTQGEQVWTKTFVRGR